MLQGTDYYSTKGKVFVLRELAIFYHVSPECNGWWDILSLLLSVVTCFKALKDKK